jgi:hypothetical protein
MIKILSEIDALELLENSGDLNTFELLTLLDCSMEPCVSELIFQEILGSIAQSKAPDMIKRNLIIQTSTKFDQVYRQLTEKMWYEQSYILKG